MWESPSNRPLSWLLVHTLVREGALDWLELLCGELADEACTFGLSAGSDGGGGVSNFGADSGLGCDSAIVSGGGVVVVVVVIVAAGFSTARVRRPTGEGVKNLERPSISPLVFLFTESGAEEGRLTGVGGGGGRGGGGGGGGRRVVVVVVVEEVEEVEEEEEVVISTAQRGPLVSVTDAA